MKATQLTYQDLLHLSGFDRTYTDALNKFLGIKQGE